MPPRKAQTAGPVTLEPLQMGAAGTANPTGYVGLAAIVGGDSVSRVLRVRLYAPGDTANYQSGVGFYGGDPSGPALAGSFNQLADAGRLRIELGSTMRRVVWADLAPGDYFIPAAENVAVEVARWTPQTGATPSGSVQVQAELTECDAASDFKPLTLTGYAAIAGTASASMRIPPGAYAVDVQAQRGVGTFPTVTDWTSDGSNGPIFECSGGNVYLLRNFQTQVEFPGGMQPLAGPSVVAATSPYSLVVLNKAASGTHACKAVFYVR